MSNGPAKHFSHKELSLMGREQLLARRAVMIAFEVPHGFQKAPVVLVRYPTWAMSHSLLPMPRTKSWTPEFKTC